MMQAMFSDDFIESSARVVKFPGVSRFEVKNVDFLDDFLFVLVLHLKSSYTSSTPTEHPKCQLQTVSGLWSWQTGKGQLIYI